jgi:hypothetical protein
VCEFYTNGAEGVFSRLRGAEIWHPHDVAGAYLIRYARGARGVRGYRRVDNGSQVRAVIRLAMRATVSIDSCGYCLEGQN